MYIKNALLAHSICLNTHLHHYLNAHISVHLSACTPVWLTECGHQCPSVHTPVWLPECTYHCPFVCPHTLWLHECTHQLPSVCLHTCMTIWMYMPECPFVFHLHKSDYIRCIQLPNCWFSVEKIWYIRNSGKNKWWNNFSHLLNYD